MLQKGGFSLIHANTTLNLPPCSTIQEIRFILEELHEQGILKKSEDMELQLSIPGRLPQELCAILGSAMILSKRYQVFYDEKAFKTTHDSLTGACMVAYDAGVLIKE